MQPTYFASFLLGKPGKESPSILSIFPYLEDWIFKNRNRKIERPENFDLFGENTYLLTKSTSIQTRYLKDVESELLALRYEHPDNLKRRWRTDVVLDASGIKDNEIRCSISVHVGNVDGSIVPLGDVASRPSIVPKLINVFGAHEAYALPAKPAVLDEKNINLFSELLSSNKRHIPIILITPKNSDGSFIVDVKRIADQLAGMAYVIFAKNPDVTYQIRDVIGFDMNVYNGAVRIYWPKFNLRDAPYRHSLWIPEQVQEIEAERGGFAHFLLRNLAKISATRFVRGVVRWEDVQRRKLQIDAKSASGETELRELLSMALEESHAEKLKAESLGLIVEEYQIKLEEYETIFAAKSAECEQWRLAYIDIIKSRQESEDISIQNFSDVRDVIEYFSDKFKDKIVFLPQSLRKEAIFFEKIDILIKAFNWISGDYLNSRLGRLPCSDLDLSCRSASGMFYRPHQSKTTMGRFEDDYKILRNGKTNWLKEHIGMGTGTDPRNNIRIAFYFDENEKKVVIGFIGQHQETTSSN